MRNRRSAEHCRQGCDPTRVSPVSSAFTEMARDSVVRASSGGSPSNVVDGVLDTVWSAGAGPIQWVELDLGASRTVESIRLLVAQDPPGPTTHVVSARGESGDWREVATLSVTTSDGQWLDVVPSAPLEGVRFIGIETVESHPGLRGARSAFWGTD